MRYARSGGAHIAYSVSGDGPIDVLVMSAFTISMDSYGEEPHCVAYDRRLASFCRLIRFDPRGIGASDPVDLSVGVSVTDMAQDALAVLDAVGASRPTLLA